MAELQLRLVAVVRRTTQRDLLDRRRAAAGVRLQVVALQEPAIAAPALRPDEGTLAVVAVPCCRAVVTSPLRWSVAREFGGFHVRPQPARGADREDGGALGRRQRPEHEQALERGRPDAPVQLVV
jgi:hypothetical protein